MLIVRPIALADLPALLQMAQAAGTGLTSLPPDEAYLRSKIERSLASFAADVQQPGHERYMFVLADTATGEIGGCSAIEAACGLDEAFYNYHVGFTVHASRELGVYNRVPTLYLTNDYTGCAVLCSLFLRSESRTSGAGRLLSKSRLLFMAQHAPRFAGRVIAEMRGISDARGRSPFWEGLGRHFFGIDYAEAERIVGRGNKSFIAELMPPHPIYSLLLSQEAQAVMGRVHEETAPALRMLEQEGFRYQSYIDIFDGGPTVEAPAMDIRSIRDSRLLDVHIDAHIDAHDADALHLIANTQLQDFRCVLAPLSLRDDHASLSLEVATALQLRKGDALRAVTP